MLLTQLGCFASSFQDDRSSKLLVTARCLLFSSNRATPGVLFFPDLLRCRVMKLRGRLCWPAKIPYVTILRSLQYNFYGKDRRKLQLSFIFLALVNPSSVKKNQSRILAHLSLSQNKNSKRCDDAKAFSKT